MSKQVDAINTHDSITDNCDKTDPKTVATVSHSETFP